LSDTNFASILQSPSFYHTPGTLGPKPSAFSHHFVRTEEVTLGVSFNTQSKVPDIPGISSREAFSFYTASLETQSKAPDIHFCLLHTSTEELLVSFNAQDEAPDDPSTQDCRCVPRDFLKTPLLFRQVFSRSRFTGYLARFFFKNAFQHLSFQFVSQDSVQELPIHNQDSPYQGF
jgi:hypothetical protein